VISTRDASCQAAVEEMEQAAHPEVSPLANFAQRRGRERDPADSTLCLLHVTAT